MCPGCRMHERMIAGESKRPPRAARLAQIMAVLSKYGLDFLAEANSPWRFLAWPKKLFKRTDRRAQPEKLRLALEELGGAYIKLGQAVSTRTDLVPAEYVRELARLQDDAPPVPYEEIARAIETECGRPPEILFADFRKEPLAAASLGQAHEAILSDGSQVVVKVLRPGIRERVEQDLAVMADLARLLAGSSYGRSYDFEGWFSEFEFVTRQELDYMREARNADVFRENFQGDGAVRVPRVFWEYTTSRVLVMERIDGIKISNLAELDEARIDRKQLAETCARIVLTEIFIHGFFHADPHPGNFFVLSDGTIGLIDTGMVGRLDDASRQSLTRIVLAIANRDAESLVDELLTLGHTEKAVDRQAIKKDIDRLIQIHVDVPQEELSMAQMLNDTLAMAASHGIRVQSDLVTLARCIAMSEGLGSMLDPHFRLIEFAREFLYEHYVQTRSPQALGRRLLESYPDIAEVALNLPRRLRRLLGRAERGELVITARFERLDEVVESIQRSANRLSMSVLIAGTIVGISILMLAFNPTSLGIGRMLLQVFMAVVVASGIGLFIAIWRSGSRNS